jgi:hypothetical protein
MLSMWWDRGSEKYTTLVDYGSQTVSRLSRTRFYGRKLLSTLLSGTAKETSRL